MRPDAFTLVPLLVLVLVFASCGATGHPDNRAAIAYWQKQLVHDSSQPQEGYVYAPPATSTNTTLPNDSWGPCQQVSSNTYDCPEAGTPQAEQYVVKLRARVAHDEQMLRKLGGKPLPAYSQ